MQAVALERTLTELDHRRLVNLLLRDRRGKAFSSAALPLEHLLDACDLVASRQVSPDVATMYSRLLLRDPDSDRRYQLTLCYPADADPAAGFVSALSPVGSSLLGMRVGNVARWFTPAGEQREAEILAVLFQPEDSGDYST